MLPSPSQVETVICACVFCGLWRGGAIVEHGDRDLDYRGHCASDMVLHCIQTSHYRRNCSKVTTAVACFNWIVASRNSPAVATGNDRGPRRQTELRCISKNSIWGTRYKYHNQWFHAGSCGSDDLCAHSSFNAEDLLVKSDYISIVFDMVVLSGSCGFTMIAENQAC